jgi:hypothetical protein
MVGWTSEYQLLDWESEPNTVFGFHCKKCGGYQGLKVSDLLDRFDRQYYFNQVENEMRCGNKFCAGTVRIEKENKGYLQPFQGGLP